MKTKTFKVDFNNRPLVAEFSDLTEQTNGAVILKYGDTVVMATVVMSDNQKEGLDYFPLTVDYEERFYAVGKILGGRFTRREGRPSKEAVLNGRMIDRTLRPLFDRKIRNEIQVVATVLSVDEDNDPDVLAMLASSLALAASDVPWEGPIGALRIGRVNEKLVINPTQEEKEGSDMDLVVCGKDGKINMIEGGANQVPEEVILQAFETALPEIEKLIKFQNDIIKETGKEKKWPEIKERPCETEALFNKTMREKLRDALGEPKNKQDHYLILGDLEKEWEEIATKELGEDCAGHASEYFEEMIDKIMHENIIEREQRPDGRKIDEIRPLFTKAGILPRVHGSGLFYRGLTHIMSVATLGSPADFLVLEGIKSKERKTFMHHYNFPPFSVGETGRLGNPGRREIGHGALAEKALTPVIPSTGEFPYTIRLVSETMSSNGSSSMGSVCASTLALMDAGVPIKAPVSGIAMGLMLSEDDENKYKILTDIQGPEDHHGDTDFKAAGTENGITAIQMDIKIGGLTIKILEDLLKQSKKARMEILENIKKTLPGPRNELSPYAPQIITFNINPEKKGMVIGPGGRTINKIIETTGAEINIEEDGKVFITAMDATSAQKAKETIEEITYEPKVGEVFKGRVVKVMDFGAFVEIKPKIEGLVHISELAPFRVDKVTDIVKEGDSVNVKLINIDDQGRLKLSIKQVLPNGSKK
ncbi:polyribonucleotide nucleotidyltransferase [Patescibacteria group bacterium]|nr:polyribonucleotide nucleotidyltransferase [Patescibacteria group bacterium]MBU2633362.1 polyribonucleotide nucleotidyltransferase [Patescibacteria group bacterium]